MKKNIVLAITTLALILSVAITFGCSEEQVQSIHDIECGVSVFGEDGKRKASFEYGEPFVVRYTETNIRACDIKYSRSNCPYCSFKLIRKADQHVINSSCVSHPCEDLTNNKAIVSQGVNVTEFLWKLNDTEALQAGEYVLQYDTNINYPDLQQTKAYHLEVPFQVMDDTRTAYSLFSEGNFQHWGLR